MRFLTNDSSRQANGWPAGVRASLVTIIPTASVAVSFGLLAAPLVGVPATVVMSAVVWSGTAQFAAVSVLGAGGGMGLAALTGLLANARFLPMGFAVAPSVDGSRLSRGVTGALIADASFAISSREDGRFDVSALRWAAPAQWLSWVAGTVVGAAGASAVGDPARYGLEVLFPIFYLSLLMPVLRGEQSGRARVTAALACGVTLVLIPTTPVGVPVLAAAAAALVGLRR